MADFDFQQINLALRLASKKGSDDGGGGAGAFLPPPGMEGEMGAFPKDIVFNFFDAMERVGKWFPDAWAGLMHNVDEFFALEGINDSSTFELLADAFKRLCVNVEMHGITAPVNTLGSIDIPSPFGGAVPGFINSQKGRGV